MNVFRRTVLCCLLLLASTSFAGDGGEPPPPPHGEGRRGPPPVFDASACKGKEAGDAVETTMPDGKTIRGTCQLVFLPERPVCDEK